MATATAGEYASARAGFQGRPPPAGIRRALAEKSGLPEPLPPDRSEDSCAIPARELDLPVVPVAIDGAHRALPSGHLLPRLLARVSISYLDPLRPAAGETLEAFNGRVRDAIAAELARAGGRDPR